MLLCTTSLYGNGSSQYNRVKLPAEVVGGKTSLCLRYEELGTSEGFGSFHFSKESVRLAELCRVDLNKEERLTAFLAKV